MHNDVIEKWIGIKDWCIRVNGNINKVKFDFELIGNYLVNIFG